MNNVQWGQEEVPKVFIHSDFNTNKSDALIAKQKLPSLKAGQKGILVIPGDRYVTVSCCTGKGPRFATDPVVYNCSNSDFRRNLQKAVNHMKKVSETY